MFDLIGGEALEGELVIDSAETLGLLRTGRCIGVGRGSGGGGPISVEKEAAEAALVLGGYLELGGGLWIGGVGLGFRGVFRFRLLLLLLGRHGEGGEVEVGGGKEAAVDVLEPEV